MARVDSLEFGSSALLNGRPTVNHLRMDNIALQILGSIFYIIGGLLGLALSICWIIFPFRVINRMDKQLDLLNLIASKLNNLPR